MSTHVCTHVWVPAEPLDSPTAGDAGNWTKLQDQYTFLTIEPSSQPPYFYFLFYFKHLQHFGFCWRNWGRHTVLICNTFPVAALFHSVFYSQYLSLHVSACVLLEIEHRALHIPHKYFTNCTLAQPLLGRILVFGRVLFCFVLFVLFFKNSDHISFSPGLYVTFVLGLRLLFQWLNTCLVLTLSLNF